MTATLAHVDGDRQLETTIRELEVKLMTPCIRNDASVAGALLADDFVEFGSSGQVYDKQSVLAALAQDATPRPDVEMFRVRLLAPGVALATYRTICRAPDRATGSRSLRASIWRLHAGRWQLVFHQGTRASTP